MEFKKNILINGVKFTLRPSTRKNKKYDVFLNINKIKKFIVSFGDTRYQHYYDKIGFYKNLNHNDKNRRKRYIQRHKNDNINNPFMAGFWSFQFLW